MLSAAIHVSWTGFLAASRAIGALFSNMTLNSLTSGTSVPATVSDHSK